MRATWAAFLFLVLGCNSAASEPASRGAGAEARASAGTEPPGATPPTAGPASPGGPVTDRDASYRRPAADRVVAIGDLHGDLASTRQALRLAGAIDDRDRWIGGKLVVVQTGDQIDRGDDDRAILELFDALSDRAESAGGHVYALVGNHEIMNASFDFRYVTRGAFAAFEGTEPGKLPRAVLERFPVEQRGRVAAFAPGGPFARRLAERPAVLVVGDTLFVHGGVTVAHVKYGLGRFNREVKRWLSGEGAPAPLMEDPEGPLWTRRYSSDEAGLDCSGLSATLEAVGAARMVVGHTVHTEGVSSACDGKVWRIDVGLADLYHGPTQALEIKGATVQPLKAP